MKTALALCAAMLCTSVALAAPTKKEAAAFVKDVEMAVKSNQKVLATRTPAAIRDQNEVYKRLATRGEALFTQAGECSFAANSAGAMWASMEQYSRRPDPVGQKFIQRRQEDYRDNLELCKQSLKSLK